MSKFTNSACLLAVQSECSICAYLWAGPESKTSPRDHLLVSCDASCCQKRLKNQPFRDSLAFYSEITYFGVSVNCHHDVIALFFSTQYLYLFYE